MKGGVLTALAGMVTMLVGLIFSGILNTQAATSGAAGNIGSFSGVRSFNDLLPLIFLVGLLVLLEQGVGDPWGQPQGGQNSAKSGKAKASSYANPELAGPDKARASVETLYGASHRDEEKVQPWQKCQDNCIGMGLMIGGGYSAYKSSKVR